MPEKKLAVANPLDLALPDVIAAAKVDCDDYLGFGFDNHQSMARRLFAAFHDSFLALTDATTRKAVNAAIYAHVEWCLAQEKATPAPITPLARSRETVERELARVRQWVASVFAVMEPLQTEKDDIDDMMQEELQKARYTELERAIQTLAELVHPFERQITTLEHYLGSLSVVERGLPQDVFGKEFPTVPDAETLMGSEEESPDEPTPAAVPTAHAVAIDPIAVRDLQALAHIHGLRPVEIVAFSLFDFFGARNVTLGGKQRGLIRTLETALQVGMIQKFGWETALDALRGVSNWKENGSGYLIFRGTPVAGPGTFIRSEKPLPWDSRSLFTESDVATFIELMRGPSIRKQP